MTRCTTLTKLDSPPPHPPPELVGPGLAQPLLLCGAGELSFQVDAGGLGVAPPQPGVAPPHPGAVLLLFAVEAVYGFGVRADGPQPGVLPPPPSCA